MGESSEPRLSPLKPEEWDEFLHKVLATSLGGEAHPLNIFTTLARNPSLFSRWIRFGSALLNGSLPARSRELAILRVAHLTASDYEWTQHVPLARAAHIGEDEITAVRSPLGEHPWAAPDLLLLRATDELHSVATLGDDTWYEIHEALGDAGAIEFLMLIGQYQMVAMVLRTLRIQIEGNK